MAAQLATVDCEAMAAGLPRDALVWCNAKLLVRHETADVKKILIWKVRLDSIYTTDEIEQTAD